MSVTSTTAAQGDLEPAAYPDFQNRWHELAPENPPVASTFFSGVLLSEAELATIDKVTIIHAQVGLPAFGRPPMLAHFLLGDIVYTHSGDDLPDEGDIHGVRLRDVDPVLPLDGEDNALVGDLLNNFRMLKPWILQTSAPDWGPGAAKWDPSNADWNANDPNWDSGDPTFGAADYSSKLRWMAHTRTLIAVESGFVDVLWVYRIVEGGNLVYKSYRATYFVGPRPGKSPALMYHTHDIDFATTNAPTINLIELPSGIKPVIHHIPAFPDGNYKLQGDEIRFWHDLEGKTLNARLTTGFVVVEMSRVPATEADDFIGVEVVEVRSPRPNPEDEFHRFVGEALDTDHEALRAYNESYETLPVLADMNSPYAYKHVSVGSSNGRVFAKDETVGGAAVDIYFTHKRIMNLEWPYTLRRYTTSWPENNQLYVRGESGFNPGPPVLISAQLHAEILSTDGLVKDDEATIKKTAGAPYDEFFAAGLEGKVLLKYTPGLEDGLDQVELQVVETVFHSRYSAQQTAVEIGSGILPRAFRNNHAHQLADNFAAFDTLSDDLLSFDEAIAGILSVDANSDFDREAFARLDTTGDERLDISELDLPQHAGAEVGQLYVADRFADAPRNDRYDWEAYDGKLYFEEDDQGRHVPAADQPTIDAGDITGQIIPVNTGQLEVWWANVGLHDIQWWSEVEHYDAAWPEPADPNLLAVSGELMPGTEPLSGQTDLVTLTFRVLSGAADPGEFTITVANLVTGGAGGAVEFLDGQDALAGATATPTADSDNRVTLTVAVDEGEGLSGYDMELTFDSESVEFVHAESDPEVWETPAVEKEDKIIIASQKGTGAFAYHSWRLYLQSDEAAAGFNPNEEHAVRVQYGAGEAAFALRSDLNAVDGTSEPYVLVKYRALEDDTLWQFRPFLVVATTGAYGFEQWPDTEILDDPYETTAGIQIIPPFPISVLQSVDCRASHGMPRAGYFTDQDITYLTNTVGLAPADAAEPHYHQDRKGAVWAKSAGRYGAEAENVFRYFYNTHPGFYMPKSYLASYFNRVKVDLSNVADGIYPESEREFPDVEEDAFTLNADGVPVALADGTPIPWLDWLDQVDAHIGTPVDVTYTIHWPNTNTIPSLNWGDTFFEARDKLPDIDGAKSVKILYQQSQERNRAWNETHDEANDVVVGASVMLVDPVAPRKVVLDSLDLPSADTLERRIGDGGETFFPDLKPAMFNRVYWANDELCFQGVRVTRITGAFILFNVMTLEEKQQLLDVDKADGSLWDDAVDDLYEASKNVEEILNPDSYFPYGKAITAARPTGANPFGYVTLAFNDSPEEDLVDPGLPVSLEIFQVASELVSGDTFVIESGCPFDEEVDVRHITDFGGDASNYEFQWYTLADPGRAPNNTPCGHADTDVCLEDPADAWLPFSVADNGLGANQITLKGNATFTLADNFIMSRYRYVGEEERPDAFYEWSPFPKRAQFAAGWIKRVMGGINPFDQVASGPGLAGAEGRFSAYRDQQANTTVNMISQAGERWEGNVALNCDNLEGTGLLEIYQTVLNRARSMSIDAGQSYPPVNNALLLVASRIADLSMLLGNEAFADAADPTIAFGTEDGTYGSQATTLHCFQNQVSSLLEEELALVRGMPRDVGRPVYNRLVWNFTNDMTGGEVAYALNYNIQDQNFDVQGAIDENDAYELYPQGHGDAWGYYMDATETYYKLLAHPKFHWLVRDEGLSVGGLILRVDYMDEQRFAKAASAKSRAGLQILDLTFRALYDEDPAAQWLGYPDPTDEGRDEDEKRHWGLEDWGRRVAQAGIFDWAMANALLPPEDPDDTREGIHKVDRASVRDVREIATNLREVQSILDNASQGRNPLGLASNAVPFDISPADISEGKTHFEQIYDRATLAMNHAITTFNHANNSTQLLRRQADSELEFQRDVVDTEADFDNRLIEVFGTPYTDDIGPGKTYPKGYTGPDVINYEIIDIKDMIGDDDAFEVHTIPGMHYSVNTMQIKGDGTSFPMSEVEGKLGVGWQQGEFPETFAFEEVPRCDWAGYGDYTQDGPGDDPCDVITDHFYTTYEEGATETDKADGNKQLSFLSDVHQIMPNHWAGNRRAMGEIQLARSDMLQAQFRYRELLSRHYNHVGDIKDQIDAIDLGWNTSQLKVKFLQANRSKQISLSQWIAGLDGVGVGLRRIGAIAGGTLDILAECLPKVVGMSNDVTSSGTCAMKGIGFGIDQAANTVADILGFANAGMAVTKEMAEQVTQINLTQLEEQEIHKVEHGNLVKMIRDEVPIRLEAYAQAEALEQSYARYQAAVARGQRLLGDRDRFRERVAGRTHDYRYKDMAFRLFRNDAVQKYRAMYELAARYVYLAAKAYDYETNLLKGDRRGAGHVFLTQIVKSRSLGHIQDGVPMLQPDTGDGGLADAMARMITNWNLVLKGQLGFNNPQTETNRFSLRYELFRIPFGREHDDDWRAALWGDSLGSPSRLVPNLLNYPEFRRYCKAFNPQLPEEPALVLRFPSSIHFGMNFFGKELAGGDSAYDSTNFATKIRSVGVWFSNYNNLQEGGLSNTPRVYLVPIGKDIMRSPSSPTGEIRMWTVLDQRIPVPFGFQIGAFENRHWIPQADSLLGQFAEIRKHPSFRAYHDSGIFDPAETISDSRLIGRSVWNTEWLMIIPAGTLLANRDEALNRFIDGELLDKNEIDEDPGVRDTRKRDGNGVKDIKLFFQTYAFSGSKKKK